jgi:trans-aconitate 2-methyltransferase
MTFDANEAGIPTWDPDQYHRFTDHRLRPARELLARVAHPGPRVVHDVGCGTGAMARIMAERWPDARVVGSDLSPEMLEQAAAVPSTVEWRRLDVRDWDPPEPPDVIYSNAVLHWVDRHESLFPRLVESLAGGGVLAVQMPLSWGEPSHRLMREILATGGEGGRPLGPAALRERLDRRPVQEAAWYHDLLAPLVGHLDIWETRYLQALTGPDAVLEWVRGTALLPVLEQLDDAERERFLGGYRPALARAYPPRPGGVTLFPFPRLFLVAARSEAGTRDRRPEGRPSHSSDEGGAGR